MRGPVGPHNSRSGDRRYLPYRERYPMMVGALEVSAMSTSPVPYIEPWLRGTHTDVPAVGRAVLHALDLALDDLTKWTEGLSDDEVRSQPLGLNAIAFHLRHIARSTDRILTYAEGGQLTAEQLAALKAEP